MDKILTKKEWKILQNMIVDIKYAAYEINNVDVRDKAITISSWCKVIINKIYITKENVDYKIIYNNLVTIKRLIDKQIEYEKNMPQLKKFEDFLKEIGRI